MNVKLTEVTNLALPKESLVDWLVSGINGNWGIPFPMSVSDLAYNGNPTLTVDPDWTFDLSRFVDMTQPFWSSWYGSQNYYKVWVFGTRTDN